MKVRELELLSDSAEKKDILGGRTTELIVAFEREYRECPSKKL